MRSLASWKAAPVLAGVALLLLTTGLQAKGPGDHRGPRPRLVDEEVVLPEILTDENPAPAPEPEKTLIFTDITGESGLHRLFDILTPTFGSMSETFGGGVAAGDFDGDGDIDIYLVAGDAQPNQLFENLGGNRFQDIAPQVGLDVVHKGSGPTFADMDGDGDLDLFVGGIEGAPYYLFRNQNGHFEDVTPYSGVVMNAANTTSSTFADYDRDGDVDLCVSHWGNERYPDTEHLWKNQGDGVFSSASMESGFAEHMIERYSAGGLAGGENVDYSFAPNFADINNDGWQDLLMTGDFATSQVFINNQDGTFTRTTDRDVIVDQNGMGAAVADYDNDGDLDWFVSAIFNTSLSGRVTGIGNRLYRNKGDGSFEDVSLDCRISQGGWAWGSSFGDFNNDGNLDIFHTNGWVQAGTGHRNFLVDPLKLFMANGDGTFTNRAAEAKLFDNGQGRGVVVFDSDRDGDLDLLITNNSDPAVVLYRNDSVTGARFLNVRLVGKAPNTQALGARIYVTAGETTQMRELSIGSNYASHNPVEEHFGLGRVERVDLRVQWPDGAVTLMDHVASNQFLIIKHPEL